MYTHHVKIIKFVFKMWDKILFRCGTIPIIRDGEVPPFGFIISDLGIRIATLIKQLEELRQQSEEETLQAKTWSKMAQKTAHDIKSPLSAIMLILLRIQMLNKKQSPQNSEMFDLYISRIIEPIELLRRISKNFMKFVNIETLNLIKTDLSEFLNNTASILRSGLPPDIQLDLQLSDGLPIVKVDQDAMRSVIENLVSNAINATPRGGRITITTIQ